MKSYCLTCREEQPMREVTALDKKSPLFNYSPFFVCDGCSRAYTMEGGVSGVVPLSAEGAVPVYYDRKKQGLSTSPVAN